MHSLRSATGVLVLSTALLVTSAGGAIATAETGTSDSASTTSSSADSDATASSSSSSSASSSTDDSVAAAVSSDAQGDQSLADVEGSPLADDEAVSEALAVDLAVDPDADAVVPTDEGAVAALDVGSVASPGDQAGALAPSEPEVVASSTPVVADSGSGSGAGGSTPGAVAASTVAASTTPVASTASDAAASTTNDAPKPAVGPTIAIKERVVVDESASTAVTRPPTLDEVLATMTTEMVGTMTTVVVTLGNTVATVVITLGDAVAAIQPAITALPTSPTPITDVIGLVQKLLDSVTQSAVAVMRFPTDLATNLGFVQAGTPGAEIAPMLVGNLTDNRQSPVFVPDTDFPTIPAPAPMGPPMAPMLPFDDVVGPTGFATLTPTAFGALAAPLQVVPASVPALALAGKYDSVFDRAFGALLVPLSLWALATGALPGLVGLLVVFGAGARVGYRQAKAGFALKVAGIARFAGPGPLGVVRSGSFVVLHQRGVRAGSTRAARQAA